MGRSLALKAEELEKGSPPRLHQSAQQGKNSKSYDRLEGTLQSLAREMTTFDGWVISLYETEPTMLWFVNPERAKAKPLEMARSMEELNLFNGNPPDPSHSAA